MSMEKEDRSAAIRGLMGAGLSREDANTVVDISLHAIDESQRAMTRVCDTAPQHLRLHVAGNAMVQIAENMIAGLAAMRAMGIKIRETN